MCALNVLTTHSTYVLEASVCFRNDKTRLNIFLDSISRDNQAAMKSM